MSISTMTYELDSVGQYRKLSNDQPSLIGRHIADRLVLVRLV